MKDRGACDDEQNLEVGTSSTFGVDLQSGVALLELPLLCCEGGATGQLQAIEFVVILQNILPIGIFFLEGLEAA